jgi:hypothetical protein
MQSPVQSSAQDDRYSRYGYYVPRLKIGQVFWSVKKLLVCVRVSDCSARVIETTLKQVEDPNHIYDEFDRYGYRITSHIEMGPGEHVCFLPMGRFKFHESTYRPINRAPLGVDIVPIPDRSQPSFKRKRSPSQDVHKTVVEDDEQVTVLEVLEMSARISTGLIRSSLKGSRP